MNPAHAEARAELVLETPILAPFGATVRRKRFSVLPEYADDWPPDTKCAHTGCREHLAQRGHWEHHLQPTRDCAIDVDLNLHGSYPASTSIQLRITEQRSDPVTGVQRLPGGEPDTLLANEAQALLDAAASQEQVETERLCAFARACLEMLETGRLALAVLDGGLFASRRALELAAHVLRDAERHAAGNNDADAIKETVA